MVHKQVKWRQQQWSVPGRAGELYCYLMGVIARSFAFLPFCALEIQIH